MLKPCSVLSLRAPCRMTALVCAEHPGRHGMIRYEGYGTSFCTAFTAAPNAEAAQQCVQSARHSARRCPAGPCAERLQAACSVPADCKYVLYRCMPLARAAPVQAAVTSPMTLCLLTSSAAALQRALGHHVTAAEHHQLALDLSSAEHQSQRC